MKVAVYGGFYRFRNYGDDMAAVLTALALKDCGASPVLFRLHPDLARTYSLETTESLTELLSSASFCVIGGGGFLVGDDRPTKLRSLLAQGFTELRLALAKTRCPLYGISIGGDGRGLKTPLMQERVGLIQSPLFQGASVRVRKDLKLLSFYAKPAEFYPDLLWNAAERWNIRHSQSQDGYSHIALQLWDTPANRFVVSLLKLLTPLSKKTILHFVRSYGPETEVGKECLPAKESDRIRIHRYRDPQETLRFLASMDLLITQKLHLALTALSVRTPVIEYRGKRKSRHFFRTIQAPEKAWKGISPLPILALTQNPDKVKRFGMLFDFDQMEDLKRASLGHYGHLKGLVEKYRSVGATG